MSMLRTIGEATEQLRSGETTASDLVSACLDRIDAANEQINACRTVFRDESRERAADVDRRIAAGEPVGPLAGIPIALKDNIASTLGTTACGSRMLEHYRSPFDATVVQRLLAADAIVIGRTNCDEFAMGSSTEHCAFGRVLNPWCETRVPGGSSGGSAAAVASGMCMAALGSDTGGSIRQPASFCGTVGLKPTYGRVSRYGLVAFGSSLDQVGPLTHTVDDAALLLDLLAGPDPFDSTCADREVPSDELRRLPDLDRPPRLGVPRQYLDDRCDPAVLEVVRSTIDACRAAGASVVELDLPLTDFAIATYYVIAPAEASSNLARFDGIRFGHRAAADPGTTLDDLYAGSRAEALGPEVRRRIMLGTYVLSSGYYDAYYRRAQQARRLIQQELDDAFESCDVIVGPTSPGPAFRFGSRTDPVMMYLCDVFTAVANIAGICALSLPVGMVSDDGENLPVGLHLQCPAWEDVRLLRIARWIERLTAPTLEPYAPKIAS